MRRQLFGIRALALILFSLASPVNAAQANEPQPESLESWTDQQLARRYDAATKADEKDYCGTLVPLLRQMEGRRTFDGQARFLRIDAEMQCAIVQRQWDAAWQRLTLNEANGIQYPDRFAAALASAAGVADAATARYLKFFDSVGDTPLDDQEVRALWEPYRATVRAKRPDLRAAFFRALAEPARIRKIPESYRSEILSTLFEAEVDAGEIDAARSHLDYANSADTYVSALADRHYEKLWPDLEKRAGPHLENILLADVERRTQQFSAEHGSDHALQDLANAYLRAGRFEDAVTLVERARPAAAAAAQMSEDMAWALNAEAYALDALGEHGKADAIFEQLAAIPLSDQSAGWLVSFVINGSARLVSRGDYQRGLAATAYAAKITEKSGNDYAMMLIRRNQICALSGLGRGTEAKALVKELLDHLDDASGAALQAILCAGEDERAASIAISRLSDPDQASAMVAELQPGDFAFFEPGNILPNASERLRHRPEVEAAYVRVGRDIPEQFIPLAAKRRAELAKR